MNIIVSRRCSPVGKDEWDLFIDGEKELISYEQAMILIRTHNLDKIELEDDIGDYHYPEITYSQFFKEDKVKESK